MTVRGQAATFEGNVLVQVREDGMLDGANLGFGPVTGRGDGVLGDFAGDIAFDRPEPAGAVVFPEPPPSTATPSGRRLCGWRSEHSGTRPRPFRGAVVALSAASLGAGTGLCRSPCATCRSSDSDEGSAADLPTSASHRRGGRGVTTPAGHRGRHGVTWTATQGSADRPGWSRIGRPHGGGDGSIDRAERHRP